jgi:hypothetical protein
MNSNNVSTITATLHTISYFQFERSISTWIGAAIGTTFTCLTLQRYIRCKHQRTHFTYVYHCSLVFSLLLSFLCTPLQTLTDYFRSNLSLMSDQQRQLWCNFHLIAFFISSAGIGYSIAYASLERTLFIFYSMNPRLTWTRQFTPMLIIFTVCSLVVTLVVVLTRCSPNMCQSFYRSVSFHVLWFVFQFIVPFTVMLLAIASFLHHINVHTQRLRLSVNRTRSKKKFRRILLHLNIYSLYFLYSVRSR